MKIRAAGLLLVLVALPAAARCYRVDAAASHVSFSVDQEGSPFHGRFRRFGGSVCLAQGKVARIDVWLAPASVDTGLPELDVALKGDDFFAVAKYPHATFTSDAISGRDGHERAHGTLEIKGTRRTVEVPFAWHPGGTPTMSGAFSLERLAYGIGTGQWANTKWLGAKVGVRIAATLVPSKR